MAGKEIWRQELHRSQSTPKLKKQVSLDEVITISAVIVMLFRILNPAFADWFTQGNANYFGSLTAWFVVITIIPLFYRIDPLYVHDLFAPGLSVQLIFAKLACFCFGCCSGFEMPGSWYFNQGTERYEFPVQLVEALIALALFVFMRRYQKRNKIPGSVFPVYLILYSISRFATEFLRGDLPNVLGPFDAYQLLSIVYAAIGVVLLYVVRIHQRRVECISEETDSAHKCARSKR